MLLTRPSILSFVFLLMTLSLISAQSRKGDYGFANYEVVYHHFRETPDGKNTVLFKSTNDIIDYDKILKNYTSILYFNNVFSKYQTHKAQSLSKTENIVGDATVGLGETYYNCIPEDNRIKEKVSKGGVEYIYDKYKIDWTITDEETIINGIKCIKAIGLRHTPGWNPTEYIAWYSPDIPVPFGPSDVNGLPGLIVKYKWSSLVVEAYSITNIEDKKVTLKLPGSNNIQDQDEVNKENLKKREEILKNRK